MLLRLLFRAIRFLFEDACMICGGSPRVTASGNDLVKMTSETSRGAGSKVTEMESSCWGSSRLQTEVITPLHTPFAKTASRPRSTDIIKNMPSSVQAAPTGAGHRIVYDFHKQAVPDGTATSGSVRKGSLDGIFVLGIVT